MDDALLLQPLSAVTEHVIQFLQEALFGAVEPVASTSGATEEDWQHCVHMRVHVRNEDDSVATCAVCNTVLAPHTDALACGSCAKTVVHAACWRAPFVCAVCSVTCVQ